MTTFATAFATASPQLAFIMPGGWEWIVLLVIGLLVFGRRLPEVGKWLGQGIVEFKRGIKGINDEIETESSRRPERLEDQSARRVSTTQTEQREPAAEGLQPPQ